MATVHTVDADGYTSLPDQRGGSISLGGLLKRARERRGLTLQEVAKQTKLPQRHLEALEQDNLGLLPSFYERAEVRTYAQAVGLDPSVLKSQLDSALKPVDAPAAPREVPKTSAPRVTRTLATIALVVITVAVLGYAISQRTRAPIPEAVQSEQPEPATLPTPSVKSAAPVSSEQPDAIAASDVRVGAPTQTTEPRPPADEPRPLVNAVTELVVTTEPAGARVTVNGIAWGVSPVTIRHLPSGDKHIRVTLEGYASQERVLKLEAGQQRALDIPLETTP
jgi:cytoskeleton protein RodZ